MTFTPDELRRLRISDRAEESPATPHRRPGRPCIGLEPIRYKPRRSRWGGRPRKPYVDAKTARRRKQQREYHQRRKLRADRLGAG